MWWSISGDGLLDALRRASQGDDPDLLYAELYANTETQEKPMTEATTTHTCSCGDVHLPPDTGPGASDV